MTFLRLSDYFNQQGTKLEILDNLEKNALYVQ